MAKKFDFQPSSGPSRDLFEPVFPPLEKEKGTIERPSAPPLEVPQPEVETAPKQPVPQETISPLPEVPVPVEKPTVQPQESLSREQLAKDAQASAEGGDFAAAIEELNRAQNTSEGGQRE